MSWKRGPDLHKACFTLKPIEDGYVFVKKGNVYITRTAKKYTRELGKTVYIVHKGLNSVLGIQVPKEVHEKAVAHEEMTREDRSKCSISHGN
jgi:Mn-dependent DtxR family transcriptional regulator